MSNDPSDLFGQLGNMNMADMFNRVADMQKKMAAAQEELANKTVTADAGGGMVTVTANGQQRITAIKIEAEAIDPDDPELLEDLIIAGVNKALDEAAEMARSQMSGMLPPGMNLGQFGL